MKYFLRILAYAWPFKRFAFLNAFFNILTTIFSIASLAAVVPILDLIFDQQKRVYEKVEWELDKDAILNNLYYLITVYVEKYDELYVLAAICVLASLLFLIKNLTRYLASYFIAPLKDGVVHRVRVAVHRKCLDLPLSYFSEQRKGDVLARMTTDVAEVQATILSSLAMVVREPIMIIAHLAVLIFWSPRLTLFVFLVMPISIFIISVIGKSLKRSARRAQGQLGYVLSVVEETLGGMRIIKGFSAEERIDEKFAQASEDFRRTSVKVQRKKDASSPISEFLGATVMMGVIWYGGKLVLIDKEMTGGALIAYVGFFYQIIPPFKSLTQAIYNIQKGNASAERILQVLDAENPITDKEDAYNKTSFEDEIEFEDVNFSYDPQGPLVLKDVNFKIRKGQTIALVGPSGSGKTTISNLIPRFYDINSGALKIDGHDVRDLTLSSLRGMLGIVNQESILFNDSVANNIRLGKPEASMEEVIAAAKIANADEFVSKLEAGYDTNIGEGGNKLSGGQKQRVSIARAILNDPPILILDEATSALDTESEKLVQQALNNLMENRTSIIIAHRLSTIVHADEILVLEEGKVKERGNHDQLMAQEGLYYKLCEMQSFE